MSWPLVGFAVAILLGVTILGIWGTGWFSSDIDRPSPPCPEDWSEHPHDGICMQEQESCRAWITSPGGSITRTVNCSSLSRDGRALLDADLSLSSGSARILVLDGDGESVYDSDHSSLQGETRLKGASGEWTLQVEFRGATGMGEIWLWG